MNSTLKHFVRLTLAAALVLSSASAMAVPSGMAVESFVQGLQFPVSLTPTPTGDILVAEKFGTVRLIRDGKLLEQPIASVDVTTQNEAGLIGITPFPDFAETGEFLIVYTPEEPLDKIFVSKMQLDGDRARILEERFIELPSRASTDRHYAGNARFGPDGMLYVAIGELRKMDWSQDTSNLPGSMLRFNPDGTVPDDNPYGNAIYAYGFRNPFDFDIDADGRLYVADNGGDVNDEIDVVEIGKNYGWPIVRGYCDNFPLHEPCVDADLFADPAYEFRTIIGPTGLMVYTGEMFPELQGHVLVGGWHSGAVHQLAPSGGENGDEPSQLELGERIYTVDGDLGITDIEQADDGALLVLLAGREGGEILRIVADDGTAQTDVPAVEETDGGGCSAGGGQLPVGLAWVVVAFALALVQRTQRTQRIQRI